MPVEFLTDEQAAGYAAFRGAPSRAELERFFFLDDADRDLIEGKRRAHNRLGFAVQLTTVRYLGVFLDHPADVPVEVVDYLAEQLDIGGPARRPRPGPQRPRAVQHPLHGRGGHPYARTASTSATRTSPASPRS